MSGTGPSREYPVYRMRAEVTGEVQSCADRIAVEEPLLIRINGEAFATVMRTPGHDLELASGLLFAEGVIQRPADVASLLHCRDAEPAARNNLVDVTLAPGVPFDLNRFRRSMVAFSSCGVCGKESIDHLLCRVPPLDESLRVAAGMLRELPRKLRRGQPGFAETGGLHAAGVFDPAGALRVLREDVGRHNAVDKVVGAALRHDLLPLDHSVLLVSGRASYEIVQKARVAGIPLVAAVSAPSSLAVELAAESGQTLIGFVREQRFNVYSHPERVI